MNNNDEHLSLGNLFRIIKDSSKNKISALQSELFCTLFDLEGINDTTVNNYCIGYRAIGIEYKKRFNRNEESQGVRILTAKNREKNFEDLCDVIGPPSRVMRWCCTVFKTGAFQKASQRLS